MFSLVIRLPRLVVSQHFYFSCSNKHRLLGSQVVCTFPDAICPPSGQRQHTSEEKQNPADIKFPEDIVRPYVIRFFQAATLFPATGYLEFRGVGQLMQAPWE
jgi:hypothetical protein